MHILAGTGDSLGNWFPASCEEDLDELPAPIVDQAQSQTLWVYGAFILTWMLPLSLPFCLPLSLPLK